MSFIAAHPYLAGTGALLFLIGGLLWRWAARHDLKGLAFDAAWHVARNRGKLASAADTDIAQRLKEVTDETSNMGRARKAAGVATRHFAAQFANLAGIAAMLLGVVLVGVAVYLGG